MPILEWRAAGCASLQAASRREKGEQKNRMRRSPSRNGATRAIDIERIMQMIPHRYPFLMIDRVVDVVPDDHGDRHQERLDQRAFLPGPFPAAPGDAGRADHRGDGADRRGAGRAHAGPGLGRQARLLHVASTARAFAARWSRATSCRSMSSKQRNARQCVEVQRRGEGRRHLIAEATFAAMILDDGLMPTDPSDRDRRAGREACRDVTIGPYCIVGPSVALGDAGRA